jgi:hypothetical protein
MEEDFLQKTYKDLQENVYKVAMEIFQQHMDEWRYPKNKQDLFKRFYDDEIMDCAKEMVQDHLNEMTTYSLENPNPERVTVYISGVLRSASPQRPIVTEDEKVQYDYYADKMRDGYSTKNYENGEKYEGEWKDDKREGMGFMKYSDKSEYYGEWKDDKPNGRGKSKVIVEMYDKYDGEFKDGNKEGFGRMEYHNGDFYDGQWIANMKHGIGRYIHNNDVEIYEGQWENDQKNGKGKVLYANGDEYEGEWKDNLREGFGKMTSREDRHYTVIYEGQWVNDKREGKGI